LKGSYTATAFNFLQHVLIWELELKVPEKLQDIGFYQMYSEVSTDARPDFYESF